MDFGLLDLDYGSLLFEQTTARIVRYTLEPTGPCIRSIASSRPGLWFVRPAKGGMDGMDSNGDWGRGEALSREASGSYPVGIGRTCTGSQGRWGWW